MNKTINEKRVRSALIAGVVCSLLAVALLLSPVQTALADLPPRHPPKPDCQAAPKPATAGAFVELHVHFGPAWPWSTVHWQDLWTVVQWQDEKGHWHDVEGWRGRLNYVVAGEGGETVGTQVWWIAESDLGGGPFRWLIFRGEEGGRLATSELFYPPDCNGRTVSVEVSLAP